MCPTLELTNLTLASTNSNPRTNPKPNPGCNVKTYPPHLHHHPNPNARGTISLSLTIGLPNIRHILILTDPKQNIILDLTQFLNVTLTIPVVLVITIKKDVELGLLLAQTLTLIL